MAAALIIIVLSAYAFVITLLWLKERLATKEGAPIPLPPCVSELKRLQAAHHALQHEQEILRTAVDTASNVIFIKDLEGRYIFANAAFERIFHLKIRGLMGKTDFEIFPKEIAAKFETHDRIVRETGEVIEFEEAAPV